jgi:two-component system LytT family response regulator
MTASRLPVRTILVDDEPPALRRLRSLLAHHEEIRIVGEYSDGTSAIEGIRRHQPALVFLDVQMPDVGGFDILTTLGPRTPLVVFVTAYSEHAIRAFEAQAFDYLLKPLTRERVALTVERVLQRLDAESAADLAVRLEHLLGELAPAATRARRIPVQVDGRVLLLDTAQVDWVEVEDNYLGIHVGRTRYALRGALTALEERLPPGQFLRIHRARLVNVDRIREIQPWFHGDYVVVMAEGTRLISGPTYRDRVRELIGRH